MAHRVSGKATQVRDSLSDVLGGGGLAGAEVVDLDAAGGPGAGVGDEGGRGGGGVGVVGVTGGKDSERFGRGEDLDHCGVQGGIVVGTEELGGRDGVDHGDGEGEGGLW